MTNDYGSRERWAMIPAFDLSGVLPPYLGADPTIAPLMSPYQASMVEVVRAFSRTPERLAILEGLLQYRAALMAAGVTNGFQWLDGSFVENIEALASRAPGDIDVVTFFRRPVPDAQWQEWSITNGNLFNPSFTKATYKCDAYGVDLGTRPEHIVQQTKYWFGLFSHQRVTKLWKGMVQVQLDSADDAGALALLRGHTP